MKLRWPTWEDDDYYPPIRNEDDPGPRGPWWLDLMLIAVVALAVAAIVLAITNLTADPLTGAR